MAQTFSCTSRLSLMEAYHKQVISLATTQSQTQRSLAKTEPAMSLGALVEKATGKGKIVGEAMEVVMALQEIGMAARAKADLTETVVKATVGAKVARMTGWVRCGIG